MTAQERESKKKKKACFTVLCDDNIKFLSCPIAARKALKQHVKTGVASKKMFSKYHLMDSALATRYKA